MGKIMTYIGTKIVRATPMTENEFCAYKGGPLTTADRDGYMVSYADGYQSWSPKDVFEEAYRPVSPNEALLAAFMI